jgi:hypothetical protein
LHALLLVLRIGEGHPAADLHLVGGRGRCDHLGALHPLVEIAQVPLKVGLTLFVGLFALGGLEAVFMLQLRDLGLQLRQPLRSDDWVAR